MVNSLLTAKGRYPPAAGGWPPSNQVEKVAALPVFDFDQPEIEVEVDLALNALLHILVGDETALEGRRKPAFGGTRLIESRLRRRREQGRGAVKARDFDEDRTRLLGAAAAYDGKRPFNMAAPHIGGDPDRALQAHEGRPGRRLVEGAAAIGGEFLQQALGNLAGLRYVAVELETRDRFVRLLVRRSARTDGTVAVTGEQALHGKKLRISLDRIRRRDRTGDIGFAGRFADLFKQCLAWFAGHAQPLAFLESADGLGDPRPGIAVDAAVIIAAARKLLLHIVHEVVPAAAIAGIGT